MKRNVGRIMMVVVLVIAAGWALFPDIIPGPIDDCFAAVVAVLDGVALVANRLHTMKQTAAIADSGC